MNIMISQPMKGLSHDEVMNNRKALIDKLQNLGHTVIDTVFDINAVPEKCNKPIWCLGRSLQALAMVDAVVFMEGWDKARGCKIEHLICEQYGMPFYEENEVNEIKE